MITSQLGYYTNLFTDKNKNLHIVLNKDIENLDEDFSNINSDDALEMLLEDHFCNGFEWVKPEDIGALTDAPIFSDDALYDDQGNLIECGHVWWYPDYQIFDPVAELFKNGEIVFTYQAGE
jgi:hypothetical protein